MEIGDEECANELTIRAAEPEDYEAIREIYAQPRVFNNTLQLPYPSAAIWRERLANPNPGHRMLVACVDGKPIGNIGLIVERNVRRRHVAQIGMGVHDGYAGRGIGEALLKAALDMADNWLNISRVELTVFLDNERAIRLYRRTGFAQEGMHKNYAFRDGKLIDAIAIARCRPHLQ